MKQTSTQDRDVTFVRALVYGETGIGKTTSLKVLPEDKTLILVCERGLLPLRSKRFAAVLIECWEDLREVMRAFRAGTVTKDGAVTIQLQDTTYQGIKILVVESLNECNELCKSQILADRKGIILERTKDAEEQTDTPEGIYEEQFTIEDWGALSRRMRSFVSSINHLPCHTIFTCLAMDKENKKTGEWRRLPALNGQFAAEVGSQFELVLHMESVLDNEGKDQRMWRTANNSLQICKDSTGSLAAPFERADWNHVFSKVLSDSAEPAKGDESNG